MSGVEGHLDPAAIESTESLPTTPCVEWGGYITPKGYGRRKFQGRMEYAHRAAWMEEYGPIPDGLTVDHRCYNRACVAVDHLRLLTRSLNSRLQRKAIATECQRGHEFSPENTYRQTSTGRRRCRTCHQARTQEYVARKQAAA